MAGIFASIDTDIQKIRQLKAEIENVKKALKQINVKVDIDIAKGMEAQLKSLMGQYDALVAKVSEAEGKIMLSTKRINEASEKIIKAQGQLSNVSGVSSQSGNSNKSNTISPNNTETASVQTQAKAYDELAAEIDAVMGTRTQNIKRMIEEQNAIRMINEEIKKLTQFQSGSSTLTNTQQKRLEQLNNSLLTHKAALSDVRQSLMNNVKLDNAAATSMNALSQSLARMKTTYRELTEEERKSHFGKELLASINQADTKIKELDATIGNHQRNVGNYASGWNGLNMSVQQIVRELPAATMGLNTFFLAISNNLPILTDEIKRAKAANEELKKSGQKGIPVWKQLASSLFSWQSLMMVGVTVLSMHGKEIWSWIESLFKGKDALDEVTESQEEITKRLEEEQKTRKSAAQSVASLLTEYKKLQKEYEALNGNTQRQNKFIKEHKTEFQKLGVAVNDVTDAENLFIKNETAFITSLQHRAMAAAAMAQMETEYKKVIDRMVEMEDYIAAGGRQESRNMAQSLTDSYIASLLKQKGVINSMQSAYPYIDLIKQGKWQSNKDLKGIGVDWAKEYNAYYQNQLSMLVGAEAADRFNRQTEESQNKIESLAKVVRKESTAAKDSLNEAGLKEYEKEDVKLLKQQEQLAEQLLSLRRKNQQDEATLMDEGREKKLAKLAKLAKIKADFEAQKQAIEKQSKELAKANKKVGAKGLNKNGLTAEQQAEIDKANELNVKSRKKAESDVYRAEAEAMRNYLKEYGAFQQKKDAITKEYNDKIAKATTEGDKKILQKEMEEAVQSIDLSELKQNMNWEQVFGNLDKVSSDTLKKLKSNLKDFIATQKDLSPENLKELVDAIERIDEKFSERNPFEAISVSFKSLKEATDAQREAQETYNKALKEGTDEEKKNAKATLESAKDSKQKALSEATTALHKGVDEISQYVNAGNQVISIMETLGIKTPEWLEGTMSGFSEMLDGLGSIDLMKPMSIVAGGLQAVKGALTSVISLGGLIPGFDGADYSSYNEMVEKYNKLNEIWDELIGKKLEYINISYGAEADKVGQEAIDIVEKQMEAYRLLGKERLNSGASTGSHSIGKRMVKRTSSSDWQDIANALNMSVSGAKDFIGTGRMTGLFDLTVEQLEDLREEAPAFWAKMDDDVRKYLEGIIEGEERIEDIQNQINEQLTQTTFDGVFDNFISTLMDMKASSKDAAEDISEYFMQAMLSDQIGTLYQDKLKKWYERFAENMKDGSLSEDERNSLNNEYMGYIEEAMKLRDELAAATGYDKIGTESYSQSSTSRGFGAEMTHEDAGELSGRFTAVNESNLRIETATQQQTVAITDIKGSVDMLIVQMLGVYNIADETRTILADSYLEIQQIRENTGEIVKPIKQIQADIAEVRRNIANL